MHAIFNRSCLDLDFITVMGDMYAAGSESTATTLRWVILYMAIHKKVK